MSSSTQRPILFFYWNCAILATVVNSQLLEMVLSPKSRLMSSPTGTQVTEAKLVSGGVGRPKWGVCVYTHTQWRGHLHWSRVLGAGKDTWGL